MAGLISLLETLFLLAFSRKGSPPGEPQSDVGLPPSDSFFVGEALPFGTDAPPSGKPIYVPFKDLEKHLLLHGPSGCGKSTTITRFREQVIESGRTIVDIDYRGDSYWKAIAALVAWSIPPERVTLIDFSNPEHVVPANFLGFGPGSATGRAESAYEALVAEADSWGVQLGSDIRTVLFPIAELAWSILEIVPLLSQSGGALRETAIENLSDPYIIDKLTDYHSLPPEVMRGRAASVANKVDPLIYQAALRRSLCGNGCIDIPKLLDTPGHITLVNLGVDRQPKARLIGRLLVSAIQRHVLGRVDIPESERNPVTLVLDEFSNVADDSFGQLLAEGRRFKCSLLLAYQHSAQTSGDLKQAIRANVTTQLYFGTSASEANDLLPEIMTSLSREEVRKIFLTLPVGCALLSRRGQPTASVRTPNATTSKVPKEAIAAFVEAANTPGRISADVDAEIMERHNRKEPHRDTLASEVKGTRRSGKHLRKPWVEGQDA